ncbi:DUF1775 domain-containing protein [Plantactinospora siamensis]|uniref:DUF1775 domain-containing protein n=1 Tax=Plantactinospora siamensis TaxID=555372 RepID=A0ABV6P3A7_9ACTN
MVVSVLVRGALAIGTALLGVLLWAGHAHADVTVVPAQAVRGDAADLTVRLTEDRPGAYTTRVEVRFPADSTVAEVYPMSVDGWGPKITSRHLGQAVPGMHQEAVTDVVSSITFVRADRPATVGPIELGVSLGPLPQGDRLTLPVVQTYSDGTVVTWADPPGGAHPAASIALVAGTPAAGHAGHGDSGADPGAADPGVAQPATDGSGASLGLTGEIGVALAGGVIAGAGVGVGYLVLSRRRREAAALDPADAGADAEDSDRVGAGLAADDDSDRVGAERAAGDADDTRRDSGARAGDGAALVGARGGKSSPGAGWRLRD